MNGRIDNRGEAAASTARTHAPHLLSKGNIPVVIETVCDRRANINTKGEKYPKPEQEVKGGCVEEERVGAMKGGGNKEGESNIGGRALR